MMALLSLKILETEYSIYQFSEKHQVPDTIFDSEFLSISYAVDEITVICQSNLEINSKVGDGDWTCIQLVGEFDLEIKGVWAKITSIVAEAGSPVKKLISATKAPLDSLAILLSLTFTVARPDKINNKEFCFSPE